MPRVAVVAGRVICDDAVQRPSKTGTEGGGKDVPDCLGRRACAIMVVGGYEVPARSIYHDHRVRENVATDFAPAQRLPRLPAAKARQCRIAGVSGHKGLRDVSTGPGWRELAAARVRLSRMRRSQDYGRREGGTLPRLTCLRSNFQ